MGIPSRHTAVDARRADLHYDGAPTLALQHDDTTWTVHRLTPSETAALVKRLAGYLAALHQPTHDRTHDTYAANPDLAPGDDEEPAA
jgi:hypothetical protein